MSALLTRLLAENRRHDASFRRGLSNHLSMFVIALERLGASETRLQAMFDSYRTRLEPFPAAGALVSSLAEGDVLGTHRRYAALVAFFERERKGRSGDARALVARFLPALTPGIGAGAFHGLLRLAYAILADDDDDVSHGLAYLADAHLPLGALVDEVADGGPVAFVEGLRSCEGLGGFAGGKGLIFDAMATVASIPAFDAARRRLAPPPTIASLAFLALTMHRAALREGRGDFTTLHAVTAVHALRIVAPLLAGDADRELLVRHALVALAAAYVTVGAPRLGGAETADEAVPEGVATWDEIVERARGSTDEHVVKLVFTAREEERAYGGTLYRRIAAQKAAVVARRD